MDFFPFLEYYEDGDFDYKHFESNASEYGYRNKIIRYYSFDGKQRNIKDVMISLAKNKSHINKVTVDGKVIHIKSELDDNEDEIFSDDEEDIKYLYNDD